MNRVYGSVNVVLCSDRGGGGPAGGRESTGPRYRGGPMVTLIPGVNLREEGQDSLVLV